MKYSLVTTVSALLLPVFVFCAAPISESTLPNETLRFSVNWPSGVSLGEAQLSASSSGQSSETRRLHLQFEVDAGVPGFAVSDRFLSEASGSFCSVEFQKKTSQGAKQIDDKETFDAGSGTVTRGSGSGQSEVSANVCGKDALTFLYFLRQELSQGRVPARQTVFFGAPYEIHLDSAGTESVKVGSSTVATDHLKASITGPAASMNLDLFFLQDRARTLALVRVPLALGTFSMELVK